MALEPKYERVVGSERLKLGTTQAVIECRLPANEASEITKILCANAKSFISNYEAGLKEVKFNGNVNFQVIYEDQDKNCNGLDYTADFSDKFVSDKITENCTPIVTSMVVDVNTSIVGSEIKVVAIVEICVDAIINHELNALVDVMGENVYTNTEDVLICKFDGKIDSKFEQSEDIEIKDSVAKVLEVSCSPYISSVTCSDQFATVVGGANLDICYLSGEEMGVLRTHQANLTFSEEVALDAIKADSFVQSMLNINNSQIKIVTNIDADQAIVNITLPYEFVGYVFNETLTQIVDDVFSTESYLNVKTESINSILPKETLKSEYKVSGNIESQESVVDEVLGTCANTIAIANQYVLDGEFVLEGVASTTVLCYNKESGTTSSMVVDMPFSVTERVADDCEVMPIVNVALGEVGAKVRRGKDIEVSATLYTYTNFYCNKTDAVISNIVKADDRPDTHSVLTIYIVKPNETIWDIAKSLNISPDSLLEQNQQVELPLVGGEKLVVYRKHEIMF